MKKNFKKILSAIIVGIMLVATLSGCKTVEKNITKTPKPNTDPITLTMSWYGGELRHESLNKAIDSYTKKNPHVTVKPSYSGWDGYHDALVVQVGGGNAPDVFGYSTMVRLQFGNGDALIDFGDHLKDYAFLQGLEPTVNTNTFKVKNRITALPAGFSIRALAYNKRIFDEAGVEYPTDDTTWLGLFDKWEQIALNSPPEVYGDSGWFWTQEILFNMARSMGIDLNTNEDKFKTEPTVINLDREFCKDVFTRNAVLWDVGALIRAQDDDVEFVTSLIATALGSSAELANTIASIEDEVGFCLPPMKYDENGKNIMTAPGPPMLWGIPSSTKSVPASLELLNHIMADPEAVSLIGLSIGVPPVPSAVKALEEFYAPDSLDAEILSIVGRSFAKADEVYTHPTLFGHGEATAAYKVEFENYVYGVLTMDEFLDAAEIAMNEKYAEFWEPTAE